MSHTLSLPTIMSQNDTNLENLHHFNGQFLTGISLMSKLFVIFKSQNLLTCSKLLKMFNLSKCSMNH